MAIELTTQDYLDLALADLEQTRTENSRLTKERDGFKAFWAADHDSLVNANQARREAVRELEQTKKKLEQTLELLRCGSESLDRAVVEQMRLQDRLTKEELELKQLDIDRETERHKRLQVEAERDAAMRNMAEANRETGYAEQKLAKAEKELERLRGVEWDRDVRLNELAVLQARMDNIIPGELQSRLSRAEEANERLRGALGAIRLDGEFDRLCYGCRKAADAALQPVQEKGEK